MEKNVKEYNELQEYIETIITTAKLMGHKAYTNGLKHIIYIEKDNEVFMKLALKPTINSPTLQTTYKGESKTFQYRNHQTKIEHLQKLLQSL